MSERIIRNAARCPLCNDIVESKHRHDFQTCSCGNVSVDGGKDYIRRCWRDEYPVELSEFETPHPGEAQGGAN